MHSKNIRASFCGCGDRPKKIEADQAGNDKIELGRLFVSMALMFPWATKEYLLWECTIGQVIMYHNVGLEMKFGKGEGDKPRKLADMTHAELVAKREEMKAQGLIDAQAESDKKKDEFRAKYGDI